MASEITAELSAILKPLIKQFEGLRLVAYKDPVGLWTIGWGHRCLAFQAPITLNGAEDLLDQDMQLAYNQLIQKSPSLLKESWGRQAALTDFVFNLGVERYQSSKLHKFVDSKDWQEAAQQLELWDHGHVHDKVVVLPGLLARRKAEIGLL